MTIKDAIKHAKEQTEIFAGRHRVFLYLAIEALQKQLPQKPYIQVVEIDYYEHDCVKCPNCDSLLGYASSCLNEEAYQDDYCSKCGQSLDWSK